MRTPPASYAGGDSSSTTPHNPAMSPAGSPTPKSVAFELLFPESPQYRARLPMRVQIFPHDTTDSIVTTVKNFYGLYAGPAGARGVSFEDEQGNTLIARYENLRNNMVVYVRVIDEPSPPQGAYGPSSYHSGSPVVVDAYYPGDDDHRMPPPQPAQALSYGQPLSRPASRASRKRSLSPNGVRGRRSASANTNPPAIKKSRSRSGFKSRGSSTHGSFADNHSDALNGYSSGDGAPGSVSSRTKSEHLGNTEISLDNIVEGGRRKRAKFESSVGSSRAIPSDQLLTAPNCRSSPYLRRRRCQLQPPIPPCRPLVASNTRERPSPLRPFRKTPSPTHTHYNPRRVTAMALGSLACTPRLLPKVAALVVAPILSMARSVPRTRTTRGYSLHQTLQWEAAFRRRIRMLHFS